ncbi:hypothetical protein BC829DRAFT_420676 [Chytridium lagenaria]|nr:hypothetical protein BC829DRAFT_420676 [Chytridium lagenaria]
MSSSRKHLSLEKKKTLVEKMWIVQSEGQSMRSFSKATGITASQLVSLGKADPASKFTLNVGLSSASSEKIDKFVIEFVEGRIHNEEYCDVNLIAGAVRRLYLASVLLYPISIAPMRFWSNLLDPDVGEEGMRRSVQDGQIDRVSSCRYTPVAQTQSITELEIADFRQFCPQHHEGKQELRKPVTTIGKTDSKTISLRVPKKKAVFSVELPQVLL